MALKIDSLKLPLRRPND